MFSCCVAFLRLNLLQTKRARQQFSLEGWTSGDENRVAVLKKKKKKITYTGFVVAVSLKVKLSFYISRYVHLLGSRLDGIEAKNVSSCDSMAAGKYFAC